MNTLSVGGGTMTAMMPSSRASVTSWLASSLHLRASQRICQTRPHSFLQQVVRTDSRPDIVVWGRSAITIIELTVPFEFCVDSGVAMTTERYSEFLGTYRDAGYKAKLLTLEVDSRGFIHIDSFDKLYQSSLLPEPNRLPWRRSW